MTHQTTTGYVLAERAASYHWQGREMTSIKCFFGGEACYRVAGAYHVVGEGHYFLLNDGQEYEILIDAENPVESFCVFLPPHLLRDLSSHDLDNCTPDGPIPTFYERVYPADDVLMPALLSLRQDILRLDRFELEERLHALAASLMMQHRHMRHLVNDLPFDRASTRDEIYRRLYRARDTMLALIDQPLTLADLAAVAYLSPSHFLRSFKHVFHETPYQHLRRHRLEKARRLLEQTSLPVTEICFAVGYSSLGSFSSSFRRHFGVSPSILRENDDFGEAPRG